MSDGEQQYESSYNDRERASAPNNVEQWLTGVAPVDLNIKITHAKCMEMVGKDELSSKDMTNILDCARANLTYDRINPLAFILGFIVSKKGTVDFEALSKDELNDKQELMKNEIIAFIRRNENVEAGVYKEDIIRYGRYWHLNNDCIES